MKRTLWLALGLMLVCIVSLSACKSAGKNIDTKTNNSNQVTTQHSHMHSFTEWETVKAATCTVDGQQERSCYCGEKETQTIDATGHTEVFGKAVARTCTTDGKTRGKYCSVCNTVIVAQEPIAKGHVVCLDRGIAATCTQTGLTVGKHCSVCNTIIVAQQSIEKKEHTIAIDKAIESTCTKTGLTEGKHCSVCRTTIVARQTIAKKEHTYNKRGVCTICETKHDDALIYINDIDFMLKQEIIDELDIIDNKITKYDLSRLSKISIPKSVKDISPLQYATNLVEVYLHSNQCNNLDILCTLKNIKYLQTSDNFDTSFLKDMKHLEKIVVGNWNNIPEENFKEILSAPILKSLRLYKSNSNLSLLSHHPTIRELDFVYIISKKTDISFLTEIPKLNKLDIWSLSYTPSDSQISVYTLLEKKGVNIEFL